MIAKRRARSRPLIRGSAMTAAIARNLSVVDVLVKRQHDQKHFRQDGAAAFPSESMKFLQQLSALQAAGVLTDEEVSAAKQRLFGS